MSKKDYVTKALTSAILKSLSPDEVQDRFSDTLEEKIREFFATAIGFADLHSDSGVDLNFNPRMLLAFQLLRTSVCMYHELLDVDHDYAQSKLFDLMESLMKVSRRSDKDQHLAMIDELRAFNSEALN